MAETGHQPALRSKLDLREEALEALQVCKRSMVTEEVQPVFGVRFSKHRQHAAAEQP
jgi:hypothetical protein